MDLSNAKALVTGASSGIGYATAKLLVDKGARVVICGRRAHKLKAAARTIGAIAVPADVSIEDDVRRLVETTVRELGGYDILINNAGFGRFGPLLESTVEDFRSVWETNVLGAMLVARESAKHFVSQKRGDIVNVASTVAKTVGPGAGSYASSKWALSALTEAWRRELRPHDIRVMQVNPSQVLTDFRINSGRESLDEDPTKLHSEDIAQLIVDLLSLERRVMVTEATVWATNPSS
jgi:3-oxoacyl-[acyl-carrier protein] reductase